MNYTYVVARLAQSIEHETLNLRVVGLSPMLGAVFLNHISIVSQHWANSLDKLSINSNNITLTKESLMYL